MGAHKQRAIRKLGAKIFILAILPMLTFSLAGCTLSGTQAATTPTVSAPVQHTVTLTWTASTSSVSGYNVYRGTVSGGPYTKVNTALEAASSYVDNTVQSGTTYFYVVTSVDSSGVESAFSNQVKAVVPTP
jgi:fibronectin type 3 domain-containing protein